MVVVAAAQALPVLAPFLESSLELTSDYVGYFSAIVFASALLVSNWTSGLIARWGSFTGSLAALLVAALAIAIGTASTNVYLLIPAAVLLGVAYGPVNPIGSRLLVRVSPGGSQNFLFAVKQAGVSIGGVVASAMLPAMAALLGWRAALMTMGLLCLAVAACTLPVRQRLGDDANASASTRFQGPIVPARALWAEPELRALAIGMFSFSMTQFGVMSMYVTLLWSQLDMTPTRSAAMLSLALGASIFGRLFWGWRADVADPMKILSALAGCGAVTLAMLIPIGPDWPVAASVLISTALGLGTLSWSGVFLAEIAQAGETRGGSQGVSSVTAGMMVFGYLGGIAGPALFSLSAALFGGYEVGLGLIAAALAATSAILAGFSGERAELKTTEDRGR